MPYQNTSEAVTYLQNHKVVILPTDTVFGIAAALSAPEAISRLYRIKQRPPEQATALLISSLSSVKEVSSTPLSPQLLDMLSAFWPGDLTIVVNRLFDCPYDAGLDLVCGGTDTVGLRIPDHEVTLQIIRQTGAPLVASSANLRGRPAPGQEEDLDPEILNQVDLTVPGVCKSGVSSTVLDLTQGVPRILREGKVTRSILEKFISDLL